MTTAEPTNLTGIPARHHRSSWNRQEYSWIDRVLEEARHVTNYPVRHNLPIRRASAIVDSTETSEIVRRIANALLVMGQVHKLRTNEQVQKKYIELVKELPEVVEVRLVDDDGGQILLTVISATPFEREPRDKVYDAQIDVMQKMDRPLLGFRLLNIEEFPGRSLDDLLPVSGITIWSR
jgi:hypothetical protein